MIPVFPWFPTNRSRDLCAGTISRALAFHISEYATNQELSAMSLRALRTATNMSSSRLTNVKSVSASAM
jgi:hypothetical protein